MQILLNIIEDVWLFVIRRCNQERVTPLFFKRKEFDYPLRGGFGEGFDGCGMDCSVVIAAESAGVYSRGWYVMR